MPHSALKRCHIVALGTWKSDWPQPKVKNWVEQAGGKVTFQPKLTDETTHVVMLEKTWSEQGDFVKKILAAKEDDDRDIHIVNYEWLEQSLDKRSKMSERRYSFEKMQKDLEDAAKKADKDRAKIEKSLEPRSAAGLMAQVYKESTDPFVSSVEQARAERARIEVARVRAEQKANDKLAAEKLRESKNIAKLATIFKRGVGRARNELLSENHHIYMDQSGFHYDVLLTKISFKTNKNQRHALTIYESHELPHTYAFNCQYSGTNIEAQNNIIATLGSNWPTAYRAFRKVFEEKTKVEWKDRVIAARARFDREKRGLEDGRTPEPENFEAAPFIYHPPEYGPRGADLEEPWQDPSPGAKPQEMQPTPAQYEREVSPGAVDNPAMMSGANGNGVTPPRESTPGLPTAADPATGIADNDAFEKLIADTGDMPDGLDFLQDTAFDEPFDFDETNFNEAMNGVETDQQMKNSTQTQPSSQLPDTQELSSTQPESQMPENQMPQALDFGSTQPDTQVPETQNFGDTQQTSQMPETQSFGHTQVAEQAQADLTEFVGEGQVKPQQPPSPIELGSSVLGKRKGGPDIAADEDGASPKKVASDQSEGEKGRDTPQVDDECPLSPKPSVDPTSAPRVLEAESESQSQGQNQSQSQVEQGPGSGYVDFGLDGTQAV